MKQTDWDTPQLSALLKKDERSIGKSVQTESQLKPKAYHAEEIQGRPYYRNGDVSWILACHSPRMSAWNLLIPSWHSNMPKLFLTTSLSRCPHSVCGDLGRFYSVLHLNFEGPELFCVNRICSVRRDHWSRGFLLRSAEIMQCPQRLTRLHFSV